MEPTMNNARTCFLLAVLLVLVAPVSGLAGSLQLYAAGSLKAALGEIAAAYEKAYQTKVEMKFGPSGMLKDGIEAGENPDVFTSANMEHPAALAAKGWGGPVVAFTRNKLCALAQPEIEVTPANLLDVLADERLRLGTSTPKADPSGDYAWQLFDKADKVRKGSREILAGKALQLTGGPDSAKAPEGRNQYGWVMSEKRADVFLTYCTNAVLAQKEVPGLKIVKIPEELSVGADYGLVVSNKASVEGWRFGMFILSPEGRNILDKYGFEASASRPE